MQIRTIEDIRGKVITIMGLGLNGGGLATARFCAQHGAHVTVTDTKTAAELAPSIEQLNDFPSIRFVLGEHRIEDFKLADIVIKNPGVKQEGNIYLQAAKQIESDISLFLRLSKSPIIAVTGSKGKSSTVTAIHYGLIKAGYQAFLGGNITVSPLSFIEKTTAETPVVLELSSWQLADLRGKKLLKPRIAIITPIFPDHQNWYGGMDAYIADKKLIYTDQTHSDTTICSADDRWGSVFADETQAQVFRYSETPLETSRCGAWINPDGSCACRLTPHAAPIPLLPAVLKVPGKKLKQNVLNAALALALWGVAPKTIINILKDFPGTEHRLEFFHEYNGIRFYNDTTATIPEAAAAALDAFDMPPILIAGGTNKNLDFTPLAEAAHKAKHIVLLAGTGTTLLIPLLEKNKIRYEGPYENIDTALTFIKGIATSGDTIVLSPGAASFGMFKNEFDRGNCFKQKTKELF